MEKVIIDKSVLDYFDDLIFRLFEDEYFSYLEISLEYVQRILDFILEDLPTKPPKKSPYNLIHNTAHFIPSINPTKQQPGIYSLKREIIFT
jgi:hypothetical protein